VQLFDFGMTETGSFYYVMERLRGMDLQRMVERHGRQPTERVIHFLLQACLSLSEAHAIGLVHRDIKPANLFVCRLGAQFDFVKVLDFGVVSRPGDTAAPLTVAGLVMGTPAFLAPELGQGQASFDQRADIYSLGCVAFWLLTGHPPFDAGDAMALLAQHSTAPPRPPSTVVDASIPPEMDALVLECLSKDPALRPPTADVLRDRLAAIPVAEAWDAGRARAWWEQHEPQLIARTV
jgi:serine/threonine-protein kinase